jgi:hypothetical protein
MERASGARRRHWFGATQGGCLPISHKIQAVFGSVPLEAEYTVTAVQVSPSNGPLDWQVEYLALSAENRRIEVVPAGE